MDPLSAALIAANLVLIGVGIGKGSDDLAGLGQPAIDSGNEVVDAAGERVQLGIGELGIDAAGKVAGDGRIDDVPRGREVRLARTEPDHRLAGRLQRLGLGIDRQGGRRGDGAVRGEIR